MQDKTDTCSALQEDGATHDRNRQQVSAEQDKTRRDKRRPDKTRRDDTRQDKRKQDKVIKTRQDKTSGSGGNEHIRVFRHFPRRPCVPACMMLEGMRLDPSAPIPCKHIYMMMEGVRFIHSIVEGLMFNPFNQDVLEECRFKHPIKTYR